MADYQGRELEQYQKGIWQGVRPCIGGNMQTDAQKKANAKYKQKTKQIGLRFYPSEQDLYVYAKGLGGSKIKKLIAEKREAEQE